MTRNPVEDLDEVFHTRARLGIMTLLSAQGQAEFTSLRTRLDLTDGNLGTYIRVLEDRGYLVVAKTFEGRMPRTKCHLTAAGRKAFRTYLDHLDAVIRMAASRIARCR